MDLCPVLTTCCISFILLSTVNTDSSPYSCDKQRVTKINECVHSLMVCSVLIMRMVSASDFAPNEKYCLL